MNIGAIQTLPAANPTAAVSAAAAQPAAQPAVSAAPAGRTFPQDSVTLSRAAQQAMPAVDTDGDGH